jgi:hypothetical protein
MFVARTFLVAVLLGVPFTAQAEDKQPTPIETKCKELPNGGSRCRNRDGHVVTNIPDKDGVMTTTSTDPRDWGRRNSQGRGITPDPSVKDSWPAIEYRRSTTGRVTDPWTRPAPPAPAPPGIRVAHPDGSATRCGPVGGTMRCER